MRPRLTNLGVLYYNGQGESATWYSRMSILLLGKMHGDPRAANLIEVTTNKLKKDQIQRAVDLAQQWNAAHATAPAVVAKTGAQ